MNSDDEGVGALREPERAVYRMWWRILEELALGQLTGKAGLARMPLVPGYDVIRAPPNAGWRVHAAPGPAVRPVRQRGGRRTRICPCPQRRVPGPGPADAEL